MKGGGEPLNHDRKQKSRIGGWNSAVKSKAARGPQVTMPCHEWTVVARTRSEARRRLNHETSGEVESEGEGEDEMRVKVSVSVNG